MARFDLSDEEWAVVQPLLPPKGRGPARKDDRQVLNGIFYILRTGAPWRDLPERYGPHTTVYNRYVRWGERGIWRGIFEALATECADALVFVIALSSRHTARRQAQKGGAFTRYWTLTPRSRQ
ncbi:IS5 family transposase [Roseobacter sp. YSTF-M11]|uniref:IS5 family transposase n=1 Tax=Roseobacter insulae TaxID=2859783 RepID=A0A9X1FRY8_9RHOB|nr:IS5 family transposase [Roseobacter insulae]MBW4706533.1 IS5 family transposase [Roseobacter insulae]